MFMHTLCTSRLIKRANAPKKNPWLFNLKDFKKRFVTSRNDVIYYLKEVLDLDRHLNTSFPCQTVTSDDPGSVKEQINKQNKKLWASQTSFAIDIIDNSRSHNKIYVQKRCLKELNYLSAHSNLKNFSSNKVLHFYWALKMFQECWDQELTRKQGWQNGEKSMVRMSTGASEKHHRGISRCPKVINHRIHLYDQKTYL